MKKFFINISLFAVIIFSVLLLTDFCISYYKQKTGYRIYQSWEDILHSNIDANLVVNGSSRALVQYNTYILDSMLNVHSYNIGMDAACIERQIIKYNVYRKFQQKPKYLIQNIDSWWTLHEVDKEYEKEQFYPFLWNRDFRPYVKQMSNITKPEEYIPLYRYRGIVNEAYEMSDWKKIRGMHSGHVNPDGEWSGDLMGLEKGVEAHNDSAAAQLFEKYIDGLIKDSINVIFCYSPIYIGITENTFHLDELHQTYSRVAEKYNIPILDYTYSKWSKDQNCFYNATHLNKLAAEEFTTQLCHDIDSLNLINNAH